MDREQGTLSQRSSCSVDGHPLFVGALLANALTQESAIGVRSTSGHVLFTISAIRKRRPYDGS